MILPPMMELVEAGFARLVYYRCPVEIRGNAERTAGSALAIRAVTNSVHGWQRVHRYRGLTTGAGGSSLHLGTSRRKGDQDLRATNFPIAPMRTAVDRVFNRLSVSVGLALRDCHGVRPREQKRAYQPSYIDGVRRKILPVHSSHSR